MPVEKRKQSESIVILFKGGRLASWYELSQDEQHDYAHLHVELMLSVARKHRMMRLEGFRLMTPLESYQRFWVMEFPCLTGAEAWIKAEMEPPYGYYGYYEYYLSRNWRPDYFSTWVTNPPDPVRPMVTDPHNIPVLCENKNSVVVLLFGRWRPGAEEVDPVKRGDEEHIRLMKSVAAEHDLMRLEGFHLISPQADWHRAWVIEFPTLKGAEAWIDAEVSPPHGIYAQKTMHLARKWSPEYFSSWVTMETA